MLNPALKLNPTMFEEAAEMKATRDGFGTGLVYLGETNPAVVVLTADLNESTRTEEFSKKFPERFFECGVAEQNMAAMAAGLGVSKKIPFMSSYATFSPGKNWETIRTTIIYNHSNVKIAGHHSGIMTGPDGATHQALEDIAITRVLPGMVVVVPCDYIETKKAVFALEKYNGPSYMRLLRNALPVIHDENYTFEIGKGELLRKGKDIAIFATGALVHESLKACELLEKEGITPYLANIHTIKPLDRKLVLELAKKTDCVITAEDHNIIGGLGSAVAELLAEEYPCRMKRIGLNDQYAESGKPSELYEKYGLSSCSIAKEAKSMLKNKK